MAYVYRTESYHLKRRQWRGKTQLSDITILFLLRLEVKKYSCAKETAGEDALGCILAPGGWVYILKRGDHYTFFLRKQTEGHWCKTSPKQFNWRKCVTDFSPLREADFLPPSLPLLSGRIFFPQAKHEPLFKWKMEAEFYMAILTCLILGSLGEWVCLRFLRHRLSQC